MDLSAVLHPVGAAPPRVYWVRRGLVVVLLLVLLYLLTRLFGGGGDAPVRSPAAVSATPTAAPSPSAARSPEGPRVCLDAALQVTASVGAVDYPLGALPQLTVAVTNAGATPCTRDLSGAQAALIVLSGADRVWSSADCASSAPVVRTLQPGRPVSLPVPWNRRRSSPGCPSPQAPLAAPGTYQLQAQLKPLPPVAGGVFRLS